MSFLKEFSLKFIKGAAIGAGAIIPGVSGGTTAIVLGIFEDILDATANFYRHIRLSLKTLLPIISGALIGVMMCSSPIRILCENHPEISKYIFCSISLLSTLLFIKKSFKKPFEMNMILHIFIGIAVSVLISYVSKNVNIKTSASDFKVLIPIGIILAIALILPAVSFSYMLLFFGLYEKTLYAITDFDIVYFASLGLGIIIGVFVFSKLFLKLINMHSNETYSFVLGFVICSIFDILL